MSLSFRGFLAGGLLFAIFAATAIPAQTMPISWTVQVAPGAAHQGQPFNALVRAQIPYSWHLYSTTQPPGGPVATLFAITGDVFAVRGKVTAREPDRAFDAVIRMKSETYSDSVTFRVPVVASRSGKQTLEFRVKYQSCTDRFCTPEQTAIVKTVVAVNPAPAAKR